MRHTWEEAGLGPEGENFQGRLDSEVFEICLSRVWLRRWESNMVLRTLVQVLESSFQNWMTTPSFPPSHPIPSSRPVLSISTTKMHLPPLILLLLPLLFVPTSCLPPPPALLPRQPFCANAPHTPAGTYVHFHVYISQTFPLPLPPSPEIPPLTSSPPTGQQNPPPPQIHQHDPLVRPQQPHLRHPRNGLPPPHRRRRRPAGRSHQFGPGACGRVGRWERAGRVVQLGRYV